MNFNKEKLFNSLYAVAFPLTHNFEKTETDNDVRYTYRAFFDGVLFSTTGIMTYFLPDILRGKQPSVTFFHYLVNSIGNSFPHLAPTIEPVTNIVGPALATWGALILISAPFVCKYSKQ